jgi:hypothetical protein
MAEGKTTLVAFTGDEAGQRVATSRAWATATVAALIAIGFVLGMSEMAKRVQLDTPAVTTAYGANLAMDPAETAAIPPPDAMMPPPSATATASPAATVSAPPRATPAAPRHAVHPRPRPAPPRVLPPRPPSRPPKAPVDDAGFGLFDNRK